MAHPNDINLTPTEDQMITLTKGATRIQFPDRLPATLVPALLKMQDDTGDIMVTAESIVRMTEILARLINRSNPQLTEEWIMDWLDVQDVVPIIQRLLNPTALLTDSTPTPSALATTTIRTNRVATRTRKK